MEFRNPICASCQWAWVENILTPGCTTTLPTQQQYSITSTVVIIGWAILTYSLHFVSAGSAHGCDCVNYNRNSILTMLHIASYFSLVLDVSTNRVACLSPVRSLHLFSLCFPPLPSDVFIWLTTVLPPHEFSVSLFALWTQYHSLPKLITNFPPPAPRRLIIPREERRGGWKEVMKQVWAADTKKRVRAPQNFAVAISWAFAPQTGIRSSDRLYYNGAR